MSDLPGNTPEDEAWEALIDEMCQAGLSAAEARARWESQPMLIALVKKARHIIWKFGLPTPCPDVEGNMETLSWDMWQAKAGKFLKKLREAQ